MMKLLRSAPSPSPTDLAIHLRTWNKPTIRRFESEQARDLLVQNGLDDITCLFAWVDCNLHHHKGRAVSELKLEQPNGELVDAFVKFHWGRHRFIPRLSDIRNRQAFLSLPAREWQGIAALRSLGLCVPERLALLQRGKIWFQEAVVIKRVPPRFSLDDLIRNGLWNELLLADQRALLEGVVEVMRRIHDGGLGWRGTCTRHFFPERTNDGSWQMWLIDCEGIHRNCTQRAIDRDYRKLDRGLEISGADQPTLALYRTLVDSAERDNRRRSTRPSKRSISLAVEPALKASL